jgi:hypothetical protein
VNGYPNYYLRKYDPDGNEIWTTAKTLLQDEINPTAPIAVTSSGIYVTGLRLFYDLGFQKYDLQGNLVSTLWGNGAVPEGIIAGPSGVFLEGTTSVWNGVPSTLPGQTAQGGSDAFVARYSELLDVTISTDSPDNTFTERAVVPVSVLAKHLALATGGRGSIDFTEAFTVTKDGNYFSSGNFLGPPRNLGVGQPLGIQVDDNGTYLFSVTATDESGTSAPATTTITVVNAPPTVNIGINDLAYVGNSLTLYSNVVDSQADMQYGFTYA